MALNAKRVDTDRGCWTRLLRGAGQAACAWLLAMALPLAAAGAPQQSGQDNSAFGWPSTRSSKSHQDAKPSKPAAGQVQGGSFQPVDSRQTQQVEGRTTGFVAQVRGTEQLPALSGPQESSALPAPPATSATAPANSAFTWPASRNVPASPASQEWADSFGFPPPAPEGVEFQQPAISGPGNPAAGESLPSTFQRWPRQGQPLPAPKTDSQFGFPDGPQQDATWVELPCGHCTKCLDGVDSTTCQRHHREPTWKAAHPIPWEAFAYGEYVGPHRTPHVPEYRIRVADQLEFVYQLTREQTAEPYRLRVGDEIEITSVTDESLNQREITVLSDGSISLALIGRVMAARKTLEELQRELSDRYAEYYKTDPSIVARGVKTDTRLNDLRDAVDSRFGSGGQSRLATVAPDGTVQLPMVGSVLVVGLSLSELAREVNMRYRTLIHGFEITPVLVERAPRFIYVTGEVENPGRMELTGPTTALQAIALAGGWTQGGNVRQIVVMRRDEQWRLMATRLDLGGALNGRRPYPSDEIWLRDSDLLIIPKMPIQRVSELVDLYFTSTLWSMIPTEMFFFDIQ